MGNLTPSFLISNFIVLFLTVGIHEGAHAYTAFMMGDPTAKEQGRMTFNPIPNIFWPGFILGVVGGFAILGSAPVNPYRMRNPRWGSLIATAAGPISDLVAAILFASPFYFRLISFPDMTPQGLGLLLPSYNQVMFSMVLMNVSLFVFNFLPLFPLDGWHVMLALLPPKEARWWQMQRQNSMYLLFGLVILSMVMGRFGFDPLNFLIGKPTLQIFYFLIGA